MTDENYASSHPTVRISAKRFQRSPFADKYETADTVFGVYAHRFYPLGAGGSPVDDYWHLRRSVSLFDVPERPIEIKGRDSVALLEKVFTRTIGTLKPNRARYAIACLPDGGILMDGVLMRLGPDRFWYVQADGEFDLWLRAQAHGLDVEIADPNSWVLQVQGPKALEALQAVVDGEAPEMGYFHTAFVTIGGQNLLISRTGWTGEMGFEIYTQGAETDCAALWDHLIARGEPLGLRFASLESMGIRRIEAGILDNGSDMNSSMTPYATGLGAFVELDKPGFIGREALDAAPTSQRLFGLQCDTAIPFAELHVLAGGKTVGTMTAGAWSPYLGRGVGYVCFADAGDWIGRELTLQSRDGSAHQCKVVSLPFYDAAKEIPRGLDRSVPERRD
ncbi:MAG: aminomethyltransferase family protein [Pseudomonadota bacterium]